MKIRLALGEQSQRNPDSFGVLSLGRKPLTYARLLSHCDRVIADLNGAEISRGDRVAVVLPNGPEMAVCFLAVTMGASCAPLNPDYREREFEFYLSDLAPRALIVEEGTDSPAIAVAAALGIRVIRLKAATDDAAGIFTLDLPHSDSSPAPSYGEEGDEALVLHTSGTTARPKMVPLTQANLTASARSIAASLGLDASDRCLNVMPLFHIHGLVGALLTTMVTGGSIVCTPGFQAPRFLDWCDEFEPTWYTAVPTMHQAVLSRATENPARVSNSRLRFIRSCSAPLPPKLMAEMEQTFRVPVLEAYGMTEASHQIATNPPPPAARKPGSVGLASGTEVAVMDGDGNLLAPEEIGEIVLRGPGVTAGYANNPDANRTSFINGWFRTGDNGKVDREGYLFITGRLKEIINRGGQKISPREIDEVLGTHPAVANAVAFAIPDHRLGEDIAAAVVLRPGYVASEIEIRNHAADRIAEYKVPRRVVFLDELPKGPTGKLQRIGLATQLGLDKRNKFGFREGAERICGASHVDREDAGRRLGAVAGNRTNRGQRRFSCARRRLDAGGAGYRSNPRHDRRAHLNTRILRASDYRRTCGVDRSRRRRSSPCERSHRRGIDQRRSAALFSAAADVVSRRTRRELDRLQSLQPLPDSRSARLARAGAGIRSNRRAARRLAHDLPKPRRRSGANRLAACTHRGCASRFERNVREQTRIDGALCSRDRSIESQIRPGARSDAAAVADEARRRRSPAAPDHASYRVRWMVGGRVDARVVRALCVRAKRQCKRRGRASAKAAGSSVLRLRPLAIASGARPCDQESLAWWHDRLAGAPPLLALPTDRPRPPRQTFSGAAETFVIGKELAIG